MGYSYTIKRRTSQSTTWRCSIRTKSVNCPATIRQVGQSFLAGPRQHIHQPNPGSSIAASITAVCKSTAKDQPFTSAAEIATNLVQKYVPTTAPCPALPAIQRIAANANYHRAKNRPQHPSNLTFDIQKENIPDNFLIKDISISSERHLLFATQKQLEFLNQAKTWYVDATFELVRKPFYQLFTINAFVKKNESMKQVPLAMCLMSRRRKEDYIQLFQVISSKLNDPQVGRIIMDFEDAVWRAAEHVFPAVELKGCAFHFTVWSVYFQSVRTNNDIEGWHNRLKSRGRPNMNFYLLVQLIHSEAELVETVVRLVSEEKLKRYQKKTYATLQKQLFKYWEKYESGEKSALQLLELCSRLNGPRI